VITTYLPRSVLVVGGTGHTGERLCRRLARSGVEVRVLTREPDGPVARALADEGCVIREGDTLRRWLLWDAMEGCEAVVSCAHVRCAEAVVQACGRCGVERVVAMSSTRRFSRVESRSVGEVLAGEAIVMDSHLAWTIVRPTMIVGGRRDANLTRLVDWIRRRSIVPVVGGGRALVQPVFVEDVVAALMECLRRSGATRKVYNLAGPQAFPAVDLVRDVAAALGRDIRVVSVPVPLALAGIKVFAPVARRIGVDRAAILRTQEDKSVDIAEARADLRFDPMPFADALAIKIRGEAEVERLYPPNERYSPVDTPAFGQDEDFPGMSGEWLRDRVAEDDEDA